MQDLSYRRVLIVSHNALSDTQNNGKTLTSFFTGWPRKKLAQVFLSVENPSFTICGNFYRVTDYEMLRAVLTGSPTGMVVRGAPGEEAVPIRHGETAASRGVLSVLRSIFGRHYPQVEGGRDLLWRSGRWRSESLMRWLDDFAPEAVFFQGSNYPFAYEIAFWVCRRYGAKLYLQLTDDYTHVPHPWFPSSWAFHFRYMRRFKTALAQAEAVYAIGPAMREEYARRFHCDHIRVAANCVALPPQAPEPASPPLRLLYAGSIHTGRWRVLREIGRCLRALREQGLEGVLMIHTPRPLSKRMQKKLTLPPVMSVGAPLMPDQLLASMRESSVLVMVESFAASAQKVTRLSLSTKIPEYLSMGRCTLAVGPMRASSISYLAERGAAIVVGNARREDLLNGLRAAFQPETREALARQGRAVAARHHQQADLQKEIRAAICETDS